MTKREWKTCTDPTAMLKFLKDKASARRLALFAIAACRQDPLTEDARSRKAVEWSDGVTEGLANWGDENGPSDGDCYLMAGAANRCMGVAGCAARGDVAGAVERAPEVVELLLDREEDEAEEKSNELVALVRDIFGNPFRPVIASPSWLTSDVGALAAGIYQDRAFDRLPVLADALQDAGCDNADVLGHCRSAGPHVRGCWVVDLLLGRS